MTNKREVGALTLGGAERLAILEFVALSTALWLSFEGYAGRVVAALGLGVLLGIYCSLRLLRRHLRGEASAGNDVVLIRRLRQAALGGVVLVALGFLVGVWLHGG
jgi:hypothetical protein